MWDNECFKIINVLNKTTFVKQNIRSHDNKTRTQITQPQ